MKTLTLDAPGRIALTEGDPPGPPAPGEALVRVARIGICGTDLHAYRGRQPFFSYPRILGHELGVEVLEVGENDLGIRPGDRCAVEPYLNCGGCIACRRGRPNCCARLQVLGVHTDGGMRERILVPVRKLHRSDKLSLDHLALVETLGIGAHAVARGNPEAGEWTVILGAGPIGLSVLEFARIAAARTIVVDLNRSRLAFCKSRGADHLVDGAEDPVGAVRDLTGGDMPTLVFDATGSPQSMHRAFDYVAPSGRLVLVGLFIGDLAFHDPDFHRREMTLLATRNSTPADFRRVMDRMESGELDPGPWIGERASFDSVPERFPVWTSPESGIVKAVVTL